jgi:UDP-N-acetylmuramate dehydrogenase
MNTTRQILIDALSPLQVLLNEPMSEHTAFKAGGNAMYYVAVQTIDQLIKAIKTAREYSVPVVILGSGTNALFPEEGFAGLVIKNNCRKFEMLSMKGNIVKREMQVSFTLMQAESGAITNLLVKSVVQQGFGGIEFALGLPGTIGGAVAVNANYPKENRLIGEAVYAGKILTAQNEVKDVDAAYFRFGFDDSALLHTGDILLSVIFKLVPTDKTELLERANEAATYRIDSQPKNITTGMTFRNIDIKKIYKQNELPFGNLPTLLLEKSGLVGLKVGNVGLSEINPRYIINKGGGTADAVAILMKAVKERIFSKYCVQLELNEHRIRPI